MTDRCIVLLGPQRHEPIVREVVDSIVPSGPVLAVTAGWEEREEEVEELKRHLGHETRNADLNGRALHVFQSDPELLHGIQARHDRLRRIQDTYRLRLGHALDAVRAIQEKLEQSGRDGDYVAEFDDAVAAVRALDERHLDKVREIGVEFDQAFHLADRPSLARHRAEVEELFEGVEVVCIAGGHVGILLERMRLFGMRAHLETRSLVAWSAGAMAITERVILFHDSPPQGAGDAEVLDFGLGLARDVVALPHATARLRLDDEARVALLARRLAPASCVALDPGAQLEWTSGGWGAKSETRRLDQAGELVALASPSNGGL